MIRKSRNGKFCLIAIALLMLRVGTVQADTIYVWADAPSSEVPYGSWQTAATAIHDAFTVAGGGDSIVVTNGVYTLTHEIVITDNIRLESVNGREETTIQRLGGDSAPHFRLFTLDHAEAVIDGFTLTGGWIISDVGGGIRMINGTVRHCTITDNHIRRPAGVGDIIVSGAGVWMSGGLLENTIVSFNEADGTVASTGARGGGIHATGGIINNCDIIGNKAWGRPNSRGYGGGIYISGAVHLLNSSVISNDVRQGGNQNDSHGGGIYMNNAAGVVSNCVIRANTAHQTRDTDGGTLRRGAGVYMTAGLVTHSRIVSNQVTWVTQNQGTGYGGGVFMTGGTLRNSLIYRNEALHDTISTRGAGIYVDGAGARVENCTVARNMGGPMDKGDGIFMTSGTIINTISYFNFDDVEYEFEAHLDLCQTGGTVLFSCMNYTDGLSGSDNISGNPLFIDRFSNDFRLSSGSPAIDAGTNLFDVGVVDDIEGTERPQGDGYDMGAYEIPPPGGTLIMVR